MSSAPPSSSASISIHALREEGDFAYWAKMAAGVKFLSTPSARRATGGVDRLCHVHAISIHALREEGDEVMNAHFNNTLGFLSTPSARRATDTDRAIVRHEENFYPRPPRGGRQDFLGSRGLSCTISIHALREEGDLMAVIASSAHFNFYPRPPRGGRPDAASCAGNG